MVERTIILPNSPFLSYTRRILSIYSEPRVIILALFPFTTSNQYLSLFFFCLPAQGKSWFNPRSNGLYREQEESHSLDFFSLQNFLYSMIPLFPTENTCKSIWKISHYFHHHTKSALLSVFLILRLLSHTFKSFLFYSTLQAFLWRIQSGGFSPFPAHFHESWRSYKTQVFFSKRGCKYARKWIQASAA